jgi:glutathione S-transferase
MKAALATTTAGPAHAWGPLAAPIDAKLRKDLPMKLYYAPGSCSLSAHIALAEADLSYELERVFLADKKTDRGADFRAINPKGAVPALGLDDGQVLTENAVCLQYIADRKPQAHLAPPAGTMERYRMLEWLSYVATELHKGFSPLFHPEGEAETTRTKESLARKLDYVAGRLGERAFLGGDSFTLPDTYLFVMLTWANKFDVKVPEALRAYRQRIAARPAVQRALKEEGLRLS